MLPQATDPGPDRALVATSPDYAVWIAAAAGWSRSRFAIRYHQCRGESPGAFLRREHLALALRLLALPDLSITAIAAQVGYADPTVFARVFRTAHGCTPAAWRRRRTDTGGAGRDRT